MPVKFRPDLKRAAPTSAKIWEAILQQAEQLKLQPGDQLPSVRVLASQLAVKPTLIRDALLQAEARGEVHIVPRGGAFLQSLSAAGRILGGSMAETAIALQAAIERQGHNLLHLLDARRLIEVELIGRAAERRQLADLLPARRALEALLNLPSTAPRPQYIELDLRFHGELAQLAGNTVLAAVLQAVFGPLKPHTTEVLADVPTNPEMRSVSDRFHAAIYAAVADGDAERARREMHEHLSVSYDYLLRHVQQPPQAQTDY